MSTNQPPANSPKIVTADTPAVTPSFTIPTLSAQFDLALYPRQIPNWRKDIIQSTGGENDLFHNEAWVTPEEDPTTPKKQYLERYPLIQYRSHQGKAAIWGIGAGAVAVRDWVLRTGGQFDINGTSTSLRIDYIKEQDHLLYVDTHKHTYRLMNWLPLTPTNYQRWQAIETLVQRVQFLDHLLANQLIGFAKGIQWQIPQRFEVNLLTIREMRTVRFKEHQRIAFNVLFTTNLVLPHQMAVGRSVAFGFGMVQKTKTK